MSTTNTENSTHVELESGVEVVVRHDVDLAEPRVHASAPGHDPDDGWLAVGLLLGLRVLLKLLAYGLDHLVEVVFGAGVGDLQKAKRERFFRKIRKLESI